MPQDKTSAVDMPSLPTSLALVIRRMNTCPLDESALAFLYTSYTVEAFVKTVALGLYAGLRTSSPDDAYRIGFRLVRADGLGEFDLSIREATGLPVVAFLAPQFHPLIHWVTKRRTKPDDDWFRDVEVKVRLIFNALPSDEQINVQCSTVADVVTALVRFRNKTKAHGALGEEFFSTVNIPYREILFQIVATCPISSWNWIYLKKTESGQVRGNTLKGLEARVLPRIEAQDFRFSEPGIYFGMDGVPDVYYVGDLLRSNSECSRFHVVNGFYNEDKRIAEFIDYAAGSTQNQNVTTFAKKPLALPPSETQALVELDVQSNVFGNLPAIPGEYVPRTKLEEDLRARLLDENHVIITLHGRGGVGKTSLALAVAQEIADSESPRFDYCLWFSSRDIDLRLAGPGRVAPDVIDINDVAKAYGRLFGGHGSIEEFASVLRDPSPHSEKGMLFIFDNFETVADAAKFHEFLDTYAHFPNKILITSRQRAFKADFPIEVRGMEFPEARQLMTSLSRKLHVEGLVNDTVIDRIFAYSEGHAYVIRVLVGEIAKEGRYAPPSQVMARRSDIVDAVFERSFNNLSENGRNVFLLVANWQSPVAELALLTVLAQRGIDAEDGIDECDRLSLILTDTTVYGQPYYSAPKLARLFGRKKLKGDPDAPFLQQDLEALHAFGSSEGLQRDPRAQDRELERFISWCNREALKDAEKVAYLDRLLESAAAFWPRAWLELGRFRIRYGIQEGIDYALRRAVEELPNETAAWVERWKYAQQRGDFGTYLASLVGAAESAPDDPRLLSEIAERLVTYITAHKAEIPTARRGVYLATVRERMEKLTQLLTADDLARLGWLFMLEGDLDKAEHYARRGLGRSISNEHCNKLADRVKQARDRAEYLQR